MSNTTEFTDFQKKQTQEFFNNISDSYYDKYSAKNVFHNYFFNERLESATKALDCSNKKILDIGTGTGNLYDYLKNEYNKVEFYGSDIAKDMMLNSNIPKERQYVGNISQIEFPIKEFDLIFMLGVTTYMTPEELSKNIDFIHKNLSATGVAIVSFTYKNGIDDYMRRFLRWPIKLMNSKSKVMGQQFTVYRYNPKTIQSILKKEFKVMDTVWLNHTIFPFNRVLSKMSVWLAKKLHAHQKSPFIQSLSSDFIIRFRKRSNA